MEILVKDSIARVADRSRREFLQTAMLAAGASIVSMPVLARQSDRKLGVALVGLGSLSTNQIAPALQKTEHCRLAAIVTGTPAKAKAWSEKYSIAEKNIYNYGSFDRVADNPEIDVVYVVLPNSMHAEYTIRAARANKHVLCEKPMANSAKDCEAMIAACQKANRKLAIGYRLHFEPHNLEAKRLGQEKVLGKLRAIEAGFGFVIGDPTQWRLKKALAGGGALMDVGIYALQGARYVSGEEPIEVVAVETKTDPVKFKEVDETIYFTLRFPSGLLANCGTSYNAGFNRLWAGAEKGWFELSPAYSYGGIKGRMSGDKTISLPQVDQFASEMDDFALCIKNNKSSGVSGEEGLRDLRIIEAIYQSIASGKAVRLKAGG